MNVFNMLKLRQFWAAGCCAWDGLNMASVALFQ